MTGRILVLLLCIFASSSSAQTLQSPSSKQNSTSSAQNGDKLLKHLTAAESFQVAGDLYNAAIENRAVAGLALERMGNILIEEGKYAEAIKVLSDSLKYNNSADNHTNLAIAYLRQNLFDKALSEAQAAASINPQHIGAHYILGNIYYTKEDYEKALPELELVFSQAPDFEIARALGLTYLKLKQTERAKAHFEKMRIAAGKPNADLHLLFAKFYESTNNPTEAEQELRRALLIDPNKPKINFYLGYLLLQNGGSERLGEAGESFAKELKINPRDFYSLFFAGVVASSENNHPKAIPFLQKAVEINPQSGEAFLFLAQSQIEIDDLVEAEKNLRQAVSLESKGGKNTQSRRTHFMLGRLLIRTERREEGKKELEIAGQLQQASLENSRNEIDRILGQVVEKSESKSSVESTDTSNVEVKLAPERAAQLDKVKLFLTNAITQSLNNLGVIATMNNQLGEALENFSAAYERKPDFPNLARNLGIVSFRSNDFEKAINPLERQLKINAQDALVRKMLGSSYYFTNRFKESVEIFKPFETNITDDPELAYFYGVSLIRLKRNLEAVPIFKRLSDTSQDKPETLFYAAQGFMIAGDYESAVKNFNRVVALAPETPKADYFIGQSLIRLNRFADAEKAFTRALAVNPSDELSKYHLALTFIERKIDTDKAVSLLEEAINLRPDYADALYQLGKIYLEKGETEKAIEKLESASAADAGKDYVHYQLSIAYRKMSRREDAERALKTYQKLKNEERKTDFPMPMGGKENSSPK